eukprot:TRINITY_DN93712_c0_g1_i1.p1 TRINITY_DN93712_c0_g1~~TRINITY_DN93712_c0_g1_i1.p1  ORF type:complete len:344 (-),score=80.98 TRINITY_DN93712_c0_g1_i1:202-1233(-)
MGDVDWNKLYQATNTENKPTPGWLHNDIINDVSHCHPKHIPAVAKYLSDCVDGDHAHVKLKALFVIKSLAYRIPPFCSAMQEHLGSVHEAAIFSGPPSGLYGDEPYRLVREAAENAITVLQGSEHYHEQYREMSKRIVGFGNYRPGEETLLPDGSVDLGIRRRDVIYAAVDGLFGGVGAILGGVRDIFASAPGKVSIDGLELGDGDDEGLDMDSAGMEAGPLPEEPPCEDEDIDVEAWAPSTGSYIPPMVPVPGTEQTIAPPSQEEEEPVDRVTTWEELWAGDADAPDAKAGGTGATDASVDLLASEAEDQAAMLRVIGLPACAEAAEAEARKTGAGADVPAA